MIKVISKIELNYKKGKILIGETGETSSIIPHSNGKFPVWFDKHRREFYWYPVWMKPEEIEFIEQ